MRRVFGVDVDEGDRDLVPAELPRGQHGVVAREDLHRRAVDDDRAVLAVALETLLDRPEVPAARVVGMRAEAAEGDVVRVEGEGGGHVPGGLSDAPLAFADPSRQIATIPAMSEPSLTGACLRGTARFELSEWACSAG